MMCAKCLKEDWPEERIKQVKAVVVTVVVTIIMNNPKNTPSNGGSIGLVWSAGPWEGRMCTSKLPPPRDLVKLTWSFPRIWTDWVRNCPSTGPENGKRVLGVSVKGRCCIVAENVNPGRPGSGPVPLLTCQAPLFGAAFNHPGLT